MIKKDPNQTSDQNFLKNFFSLTHVIQHIQLQTLLVINCNLTRNPLNLTRNKLQFNSYFLNNFFNLTHTTAIFSHFTRNPTQSPTNIPHYTTANISNKYLHKKQTSPPKPTIYTFVSRKNLLKGRNGLIDQQKKTTKPTTTRTNT